MSHQKLLSSDPLPDMISLMNSRKYSRKGLKPKTRNLEARWQHCSNKRHRCKLDKVASLKSNTIHIQCTVQVVPSYDEWAAPDVIEHTVSDIGYLKDTLNSTIARRGELISRTLGHHNTAHHNGSVLDPQRQLLPPTPQALDIEGWLSSPQLPTNKTSFEAQAPQTSSFSSNQFSISTDYESAPFSISDSRASSLFAIYDDLCNPLLPIFPKGFFRNLDLSKMATTNELLFWTVILTGLLHSDEPESPEQYLQLTGNIQRLVLSQCWLNTPRSIYILLALVILTTWPIPSNDSRLSENYSVKLISLAKSLCAQLGLHQLGFIAEFSHKTTMDVSQNAHLSNTIRERIFKLINVNSNYWHIHLGLSNNNSGTTPNYILTAATSAASLDSSKTEDADLQINCMLKSCMLQTKINESMSELIGGLLQNKSILLLPRQTNILRSINLNMFEMILEDKHREIGVASANQDARTQNLMQVTLEYAKLQLHLYALADDGSTKIDRNEYSTLVKKTVACCVKIALLCGNLPIHRMPIYFRFPAEMVALILLRIYKSPILRDAKEYVLIKQVFTTLYKNVLFPHSVKSKWAFHTSRLTKVLHSFDALDNTFIAKSQKSLALVGRTQNFLVCAMTYEMIWLVYEQHNEYQREERSVPVNWQVFGHCEGDDVVSFIKSNSLIFS